MSVSIYKKPASVCFTADGVSYDIMETSPSSNAPKNFKFRLSIQDDEGPGYINKDIVLTCYPQPGNQGENHFYVDLTDIIQTYTSRYVTPYEEYIFGYVTVRLTHIDDASTNLDSTAHFCLPGTSGGLKLTGLMPADKHPFLLARGEEEGSLHFYRSELEAMDTIYAFVTNEYHDYHFDTDNSQATAQDYDSKIRYIDGCYNVFGIWLNGDVTDQFQIYSDANILMVYYHYMETFLINSIAIQDDPDTDEYYLIRWTNSMGAREALLLTGELQDVSEVVNQDPYITSQSISSTKRYYKRRTVTTKYSLQTGYLTQARIIALKDMLTSDSVDIKINGEWIPVIITADAKHAVHQREPESFELTIEVLEQTRYHKPNRSIRALPASRAALLQDNSGNIIVDNNSDVIY